MYTHVKTGIFAYSGKHSLHCISNFKDNSPCLGIQREYSSTKIKSNHGITMNFQAMNPDFFSLHCYNFAKTQFLFAFSHR